MVSSLVMQTTDREVKYSWVFLVPLDLYSHAHRKSRNLLRSDFLCPRLRRSNVRLVIKSKWFLFLKTCVGNHSKNKTPFRELLNLFWVWNRKGGVAYFGYFSRWAYVQPYDSKGLVDSFTLMWLNIGLSWKITEIRTNPVLVYTQNR